jgi:glycosyl transferase family 25
LTALKYIRDLVDEAFVVTIEGEATRQKETEEILNNHDLEFQFFLGADYRKRDITELIQEGVYDPSLKSGEGRPLLTPGEIGCAVSHRMLHEKVAAGKYKSILILEDDLLVLDNNIEKLQLSLEGLPADWSLLYLGYNKNYLHTPLSVQIKLLSWYPLRYLLGSKRHDPRALRRIYRRRFNSHWYRAGCFNGTHAYAIDKVAAKYLVELQTPVRLEADKALQHLVRFSGLNAYCPRFDVFDQRWDLPSLVGPRASWQ